jgi:hypothetical protein
VYERTSPNGFLPTFPSLKNGKFWEEIIAYFPFTIKIYCICGAKSTKQYYKHGFSSIYFPTYLIQEHISFLKHYSIQCPKVHFRELINYSDGKYTTNGAFTHTLIS